MLVIATRESCEACWGFQHLKAAGGHSGGRSGTVARPNAAVVSVHSGGGGSGTPGRVGAVAGMSTEDPVPGVQHTQRFLRMNLRTWSALRALPSRA